MAIDRRVGFVKVEVRSLHHHHLAPRRERRRRDVLPGLAVVIGHVDETIVGADPESRRAQRRGRDRVDDAAPLAFGRVGGGRFVEVRRHAGVFARQVWADLRPAFAAVGSLEEGLIAEVERLRVSLREDQRQRPGVPRRHR